jgi:hypothetical protein
VGSRIERGTRLHVALAGKHAATISNDRIGEIFAHVRGAGPFPEMAASRESLA